ncbi:hypothetical protein ASPSYDRAFT_490197 [Aspergillus sydowii CBS 593.65]|uniref:Uncharacterized protein n=1 Tax=Aspergillus sydowii CBS 593.65 TaxID=1036612 RepID=A0A1L9T3W7_9EURO|nr:uncharacterized protein ASPSYDRAFT_490197 [Aspergillus sydowii CBS 593.65]OJJ54132.1 hypothetical protein ASPSYDRAFT_490197 [Aspergillus sydowii CBS 593.65]
MSRNDHHRYRDDRQSPPRYYRRSRSRSRRRPRTPSRETHHRSSPPRSYSRSHSRSYHHYPRPDKCIACGADWDTCRNACMQRHIKHMADTLARIEAAVIQEQEKKKKRKTILRAGPIPATDAKGLTPPPADAHQHASCDCRCAAQPAALPIEPAPAPPEPAPAAPEPAIWPEIPAPAGLQMDNGVGMGALDLINDFNTDLGGDFEALMSGGLFSDLAAPYQPPISQPVPVPAIAPAQTQPQSQSQTQTQPLYQDIVGNPPPGPDSAQLQTSTAEIQQRTPPVTPHINPAAPGLVWTGDAWHGPVWTAALPTTPARPGTGRRSRQRPLTPDTSRHRHSRSITSHTLGHTDEVSIKEENTSIETERGRTDHEPIYVDDERADDLFSDGVPGFPFTPGAGVSEEFE